MSLTIHKHMANYRGVKLYGANADNSGNHADLTAQPYLKFLLITEHEVPFMNTNKATKMVE